MAQHPYRPGLPQRDNLARPYLDALDRMQERTVVRPQQLTDRARRLLVETFGARPTGIESAFAHGSTALMSEHTHYFEGFAFLLPMPFGTAVAMREAEAGESRVTLEGTAPAGPLGPAADNPGPPVWTALVHAAITRLAPPGRAVEVAVVSNVPPAAIEAYLSALGVATVRTLQAHFALSLAAADLYAAVRDLIGSVTGWPFSIAYPIASDSGHSRNFVLVDAATLEHLPVDAPPTDVLGWALVDTGTGVARNAEHYRRRQHQVAEATQRLREGGFAGLTSFRELDHQDLQRALSLLPAELRALSRYLVTENRRVQKMVAAARKADWQMLGALMVMSHASQRSDWNTTTPQSDLVVETVESMSLEGMYGAGQSGRGGAVLVTGRPFDLPACLDRVEQAFRERFGRTPATLLF